MSIGAGDGGQANGTVTLATPADAASGTDVSLTIVAENADGTEINNVVLRFSIATKVRYDTAGHVQKSDTCI